MLAPLILHFNTKEHTENLCRELPNAIVLFNNEDRNFDLNVTNEVIFLGKNHGFSEGWNQGVKSVMRLFPDITHFWLCNSDIVPYADCFHNLCAAARIAKSGIFTPNYNCWAQVARHKHNYGTFRPEVALAGIDSDSNDNFFRQTRYIEFTAPVISRSTFEQIGLFDSTNFNNGYGVEYDFCYRAALAGITISVFDAAEFYHIRQQSIKQLPDPEAFTAEGVKQSENLYLKHKINLFFNYQIQGNLNQRAAVYVTIFNKYNKLKSIPAQSVDVDFVCICDEVPDFEDERAASQWKIVQVGHKRGFTPRMDAKAYKIEPHNYPELNIYDNLIYIDGTIKVTSRDFVRFCLSSLNEKRFTLCLHPRRKTIDEEAELSMQIPKYKNYPLMAQVEDYHAQGFYEQLPLYACGVMVRNIRSEMVQDVCRLWFIHNLIFSIQDQISFPFACWKTGFVPAVFQVSDKFTTQLENEYWRWEGWNPNS